MLAHKEPGGGTHTDSFLATKDHLIERIAFVRREEFMFQLLRAQLVRPGTIQRRIHLQSTGCALWVPFCDKQIGADQRNCQRHSLVWRIKRDLSTLDV